VVTDQPTPPKPNAVFLDLDETTINTVYGPGNSKSRVYIHIGDGRYGAALRPGAHQFLSDVRAAGIPLYALTYATLEYALAWNEALELGFAKNHIFAREHLQERLVEKPDKCIPILIDDLDQTQPALQVKRSWLATRSDTGIVYNWRPTGFFGHSNTKPLTFEQLKAEMENPTVLEIRATTSWTPYIGGWATD
jgi:hypothetical protein